jgi:hypothetical protein
MDMALDVKQDVGISSGLGRLLRRLALSFVVLL